MRKITGETLYTDRPFVCIESPYAGEVQKNVAYARRAMRHSILHSECPIASHLLYTQKGILDDTVEIERQLGIDLGFAVAGALVNKVAFYVERGWSPGMLAALKHWMKDRMESIVFRSVRPLPVAEGVLMSHHWECQIEDKTRRKFYLSKEALDIVQGDD